jgi:hypothetical protein
MTFLVIKQAWSEIIFRRHRVCLTLCIVLLGMVLSGCEMTPQEPAIWFIQNAREVRTFNPRTEQQHVIVPAEPDTWIDYPMLSPDGTRITYVKATDIDGSAVWLARADGSEPRRITYPRKTAVSLWITNTQLLIMSRDDPSDSATEQDAIYDLGTGKLKSITIPENRAACDWYWSSKMPTRVTIWAKTSGLGHLVVASDKLLQIVDIPVAESQLPNHWKIGCMSWTLDAKTIILVARDEDWRQDLFLVSDSGRSVTRLTLFTQEYRTSELVPSISPDGEWVGLDICVDKGPSSAPLDGCYVGLLGTDHGSFSVLLQTYAVGNIVWSPDSRYFAAGLTARDNYTDTAPKQLHIFDRNSQEIKQVIFDGLQQEVFDWR